MASENMPVKDLELQVWATNFATIAAANATDLGLTTAQTTLMTTYATLYSTKMTAVNVAKNAAKTAVTEKNGARGLVTDLFGGYAKAILANPDVTDGLKNELGMTVGPTSPTAVSEPIDLVANPKPTGTVNLKWKRGDNSPSVSFVIEARFGLSPNWVMIGQTQRQDFKDTGRVPGEMISYRVIAQRGGVSSDPSNSTTIYPVSEPETVFLKQAA